MKFELQIESPTRDAFLDITPQVRECMQKSGVHEGICVVLVPHASAGLSVYEHWDEQVVGDTLDTLDRLGPWEGEYRHQSDNAASHVKSCLVGNSQTLLFEDGNLVLGEYQGLFLAEFSGPRPRRVLVRVMPDECGA